MTRRVLPGLLFAVLAAGCGAASSTAGPLGPAPTGGSAQCIPDSNRTPVTVGETVFQNKSNEKLLIQKITLHDARNVTLLHTFVTPGDKEVIGNYFSYPPPERQLPKGVKLDTWRRAAGYVVQPHKWFGPITAVQPTPKARHGSYASTGMDIIYSYEGSQYTLNTKFTVQLKIGSDC